LTQWEGSVIWRSGMAASAGGEAALRRGKAKVNASWADVNLTGLKNKENPCSQFSYYKWTVKI
jgi:hypothetical protein